MKVEFTLLAERQLENLYNYIADHSSEQIAERYITRIMISCEKLAEFPNRGTRHDDILSGLRTVGFERRVTIAFLVSPDTVLIEGMFYGGQDFAARFRS
jgi:toxin ParE1/3/4